MKRETMAKRKPNNPDPAITDQQEEFEQSENKAAEGDASASAGDVVEKDEQSPQGDAEVPPEPDPTEQQDALLESELAVAERDKEGRDLRGNYRARLEAIKHSLDATLGHFENTSDDHNLHAARVTISGVRERLDAVRTEVADAIAALD